MEPPWHFQGMCSTNKYKVLSEAQNCWEYCTPVVEQWEFLRGGELLLLEDVPYEVI